MDGWKMSLLLGRPIFRVYVKFPGCRSFFIIPPKSQKSVFFFGQGLYSSASYIYIPLCPSFKKRAHIFFSKKNTNRTTLQPGNSLTAWTLRIRGPLGKGESHLPNHHDFSFKLSIFRGFPKKNSNRKPFPMRFNTFPVSRHMACWSSWQKPTRGEPRGSGFITKSFRYLKWRYERTLLQATLGVGKLPYLSRIHTAYIGEDSSILYTWNVWWFHGPPNYTPFKTTPEFSKDVDLTKTLRDKVKGGEKNHTEKKGRGVFS